MQTLSYKPRPPLASLVELIWVSRAGAFHHHSRLLPMLHHELMFNGSDRFEVSTGGQTLVANAPAWVSGLQTRPVEAFTAGGHFTVGVLFKPWGLRAFTRVEPVALRDQSLPPEEVFGPQVRQLAGDICPARPGHDLARAVETFLLRRLAGPALPPYLARCIAHLESSPLADNLVNDLAQWSGVSAKTLIGQFKQHVGLTPAKYHHLVVLNRTLRHLAQNPTQTLTESAYALGFFDQAHLIRFFRQYTGLTPSAYLRAGKAGQVHAANPNAIALPDGTGMGAEMHGGKFYTMRG
jgi:AraC-like DNA-binding protein